MYYASEDPRRVEDRVEPPRQEATPTQEEPRIRIEEPSVPEPDILDELPLLNVPRARIEPKEEPEESDRESEVSAESAAVESEAEELADEIEPNDVPPSPGAKMWRPDGGSRGLGSWCVSFDNRASLAWPS